MNRSDIKTAEPFRSLFPQGESVRDAVRQDMQKRGFEPAFLIILGSCPWTNDERVVLDGHTRLAIASDPDLDAVPIVATNLKPRKRPFSMPSTTSGTVATSPTRRY